MVRKSIGVLRQYGFVETREGNGGGAALAKPANKILLSDIFRAVNEAALLGKLNKPNSDCLVGKQINKHLTELYNQADAVLISKLTKVTLADFCKQFK